ncbi:sigma-70 family RNA polymerase sigma factor [Magnetospirillum sp. SS-4]|uniref:sigma-70 family RNA polymerase sigma factor n=1 Tax=Magnetospirillum sp. SS-4 TaxID=2681465 RepID=UPI0013844511|nr:sigma-70 family RNA polymerase sigma factor [Magnetospirillum sp. SS-4]CAA7617121.1 conserved hypothetical protein [Magnetospirillum sp. SS-4]
MDGQRPEHADDGDLLRAARNGDAGAWETFVRRWADLLYGCCRQVFDETRCRSEFPLLIERLADNRLAALSDWDGRAAAAPYLVLKTADLLADRITGLLATDRDAGWSAFERFFGADLTRLVRRRLGQDQDCDDVAQDLRLRLMAEDCAALRKYDGRGSFSGYVRRVALNLIEDILRARDGRRREPEAIRRMEPLERRAFDLIYVQGLTAEDLPDRLRDAQGRRLPRVEAMRVLHRVDAALGGHAPPPRPRHVPLTVTTPDGSEHERPLPHHAASPEDETRGLRDRAAMEAACEVLATALARLPAEARLYLHYRFLADPPLPPRRIAEIMRLPVEDLYRRRKSWEGMLLDQLKAAGVEKFPLASV